MSQKDKPAADVSHGVRLVTVGEEASGQRIDNFLAGLLPGVPRGRIYRMLRTGEVRVNRGRVRPTSRVAAGDEVRVPPVSIRAAQPAAVPRSVHAALAGAVVFEDRDVLVINKPGGIAVHGGSGISAGVVEALRGQKPEWAELGLAHRLDRETSGVLVLAKRRSALRTLHAAFREDRVAKVYEALVDGYWPHGGETIDLPLRVDERRNGERHVVVAADGKPSVTRVSVIEARRNASLLKVEPQTGRTHQIRVHLAHLGFPIAGDERYGDPDRNAGFRRCGLRRLFLHAQSIAFDDGHGGERLYTAALPADLTDPLPILLGAGGARRRR